MTPHRPPATQTVEDSGEPGLLPRGLGSPRSFRRRDLIVEAHRVDHTNAALIAEWCGGSVLGNAVRVGFERTEQTWDLLAKPGWFVIRDELGFDVLTPQQFTQAVR